MLFMPLNLLLTLNICYHVLLLSLLLLNFTCGNLLTEDSGVDRGFVLRIFF